MVGVALMGFPFNKAEQGALEKSYTSWWLPAIRLALSLVVFSGGFHLTH